MAAHNHSKSHLHTLPTFTGSATSDSCRGSDHREAEDEYGNGITMMIMAIKTTIAMKMARGAGGSHSAGGELPYCHKPPVLTRNSLHNVSFHLAVSARRASNAGIVRPRRQQRWHRCPHTGGLLRASRHMPFAQVLKCICWLAIPPSVKGLGHKTPLPRPPAWDWGQDALKATGLRQGG